jgi:hypothetical protein
MENSEKKDQAETAFLMREGVCLMPNSPSIDKSSSNSGQ